MAQSYNPDIAATISVWAISVSLATTREIDIFFLFLQVLRCFSSEGWPHKMVLGLLPNGLSHSDISGSNPVCKSPELFAAVRVLPRR